MAEQDCDQPSRSTESAGTAPCSETGTLVRETIGPRCVHGASAGSQSDPMISSTFSMIRASASPLSRRYCAYVSASACSWSSPMSFRCAGHMDLNPLALSLDF